jgi:hypothetical protein
MIANMLQRLNQPRRGFVQFARVLAGQPAQQLVAFARHPQNGPPPVGRVL